MESSFMDAVVDLVHAAEPDLDCRLESQAEALRDLKCSNPVLGRWIDTYDVQYLLAAFALNDADFAEEFPKLSHLKHADRQKIVAAFEDHFDRCSHCHLKRGYDLELNARIEVACKETRNSVHPRSNTSNSGAEGDQGPNVLMFRAHN